jgi:DNA-binding LacI/PurR family transcriptional regulator
VGGPRLTMARIAAELGVSVMSVSNAFNRPDQLSSALRERILDTARELGYAGPDALARGLRQGRTGALGVLYDTPPDWIFRNPSTIAFLQGLSGATGRAFMGVLLVPAPWPADADTMPLHSAPVDGFVVFSVADDDRQIPVALSRRPTVIVDQPELPGVPFVGIDDRGAAALAAQHLLDLGHLRIAILAFALARDGVSGLARPERQHRATYAVTRARLAGYRQALTNAGIPWDQVPVVECHSPQDTQLGVHALLSERPRPTALLATSDAIAIGAIRAATEAGIHIPHDLSVVGFDDSPAAHQSDPPLTTVRQPHLEKGRRAGELLLQLLEGETHTRHDLLPTELVVRGSTTTLHS